MGFFLLLDKIANAKAVAALQGRVLRVRFGCDPLGQERSRRKYSRRWFMLLSWPSRTRTWQSTSRCTQSSPITFLCGLVRLLVLMSLPCLGAVVVVGKRTK